MYNDAILFQAVDAAGQTFLPPPADSGSCRLYAKTVEEHCRDLLCETRFELLDGEQHEAERLLRRHLYFAKIALGMDHPLTVISERALTALAADNAPCITMFLLDELCSEL